MDSRVKHGNDTFFSDPSKKPPPFFMKRIASCIGTGLWTYWNLATPLPDSQLKKPAA